MARQLTLRTVFVLVSLTAIVLAVMTAATHSLRQRSRIEAELKALGAYYVGFDETGRAVWASFGEPIRSPDLGKFQTLRHIDLDGAHITDETMHHITRLEGLFAIHLTDSDVTDRQIAILSQIARLDALRLGGTGITDESVESLLAIDGLRSLDISGTGITHAGLRRLMDADADLAIRHGLPRRTACR